MMRLSNFLCLCLLSAGLLLAGCVSLAPEPTLDTAAQLKVDTAAIGKYLRTRGINTRMDINGIRFEIKTLGAGMPPRANSEVEIEYTGKFLNEQQFDTGNLNRPVSGFIPGFSTGLQLMPEGTTMVLYIPSVYGYGAAGTTGIPGNSNLIFTIKLNKVIRTSAYLEQLALDTTAINTFLANNSITGTIRDAKSGLRVLITQAGTGSNADWYDAVQINYKGRLLTGQLVQSGTAKPETNFNSWVINYLPAFQAGLRYMKAGSKATLYTPSGLAFGTSAITTSLATIPPNTNLIYEVELVALNP